MANNALINPEIAERIQKDKHSLIDALKEMPIVQVACKRAGVSHATYYRWRSDDKQFRRESGDALEQGYLFINDMSESQLVTLIKEKKMPAITLWLKHHHPRYGSNTKAYVPIAPAEDLTDDERRIMAEALALATGRSIKKSEQLHGNHTRKS